MKILEKLLLFQLIFGATVVVHGLQATHQLTVNKKTDNPFSPYRCLGLATAIRPGWILTSANFFRYNRADVDDFIIVGGVTEVGYGKWEDILQRNLFRRVRDYHTPNEFDDHNKENDVALVELDQEFGKFVQPIDIFRSDDNSFDKRLANAYTWKDDTLREYTVNISYHDRWGLHFENVRGDNKRVEHSPGISIVYDGKLLGLNPGIVMQMGFSGFAMMIRDRMQFIDYHTTKRIESTTEYVWRTSHQALIYRRGKYAPVVSMGSLISSDVILTPADVWDERDVKEFEAAVGLRGKDELRNVQHCPLTELHIPDEYLKRTDDHHLYNFALVIVEKPFQMTTLVQTIPILWDPQFDPSDKETIMYSWTPTNTRTSSYARLLAKRIVKVEKSSDVPYIKLQEETFSKELTGSSFAFDNALIGFIWKNEQNEHGFVEMRRHYKFIKQRTPQVVENLTPDQIQGIGNIAIKPIRLEVAKDEEN